MHLKFDDSISTNDIIMFSKNILLFHHILYFPSEKSKIYFHLENFNISENNIIIVELAQVKSSSVYT
jgi:hypothetical protein